MKTIARTHINYIIVAFTLSHLTREPFAVIYTSTCSNTFARGSKKLTFVLTSIRWLLVQLNNLLTGFFVCW